MKFNRRNFRSYAAHVKCLFAMLAARAGGAGGRKRRGPGKPAVVMYGHSLSGNLGAFFDYVRGVSHLPYNVYYATIDEREYERLSTRYANGILLATRVSDMKTVLDAEYVMTSHGPGIFLLLRWLGARARFVSVWHGVGFKNYVPEQFRLMRFYSACFVTSEHWKEIYRTCRGFRDDQIVVTGFARLDCFRHADEIAERVRRELKIPERGIVILYAPTWRKEGEGGEVPFGMTDADFLRRLDGLGRSLGATVVLRLHMNSCLRFESAECPNIRSVPQTDYPATNDLLCATDVLVTDWSSIAADFCALDRPVIFLDTPMPRDYGAGPLPMERGGIHVADMDGLVRAIETNLGAGRPPVCAEQNEMKEDVHGDTLDGHSAQRYDAALRRLIGLTQHVE